ncbi:MAG: hypothetical protein CMJ18_27290 [Phycisphaeraceae bacterium]|nr:hypothetical protein [Phycisphaeraceae bacterium]
MSGDRGDTREIERIFTGIYERNLWGSTESDSGTGSELERTRAIAEALPDLLRELRVTSMLDIPCGDFHWMSRVDLDAVRYIGADIVRTLIDENRRFADERRSFVHLDLTCDPLPAADLVFCRDCFVHLCDRDVLRALDNIRRSGATWLLTTTFTRRRRNVDIKTGGWRTLNLTRPPFDLPPPLRLIDERCTEGGGQFVDKSVGLWKVGEIG